MIYITLNDRLGSGLACFGFMGDVPAENVVITETDEGIYIEDENGDAPGFMVPSTGDYFMEVANDDTVSTSRIILGPETVFRAVAEEQDPITLTGHTFSMEEPLPERGSFTGYCAQLPEEMSPPPPFPKGMWLFGTGATSNEVEMLSVDHTFRWFRIGELPYVPETVGVIDNTQRPYPGYKYKRDIPGTWGDGFYDIGISMTDVYTIRGKILLEYTGEKRNVKPYNSASSTVPGDVVRFKGAESRDEDWDEMPWSTGITIDNEDFLHAKTLSSLVAEGQAVEIICRNIFYVNETTLPLYADTVPGVTHHTKKDIVAYNPVPFPGAKRLELDTDGLAYPDNTAKTSTWEELSFTQENYNACKLMFDKNVPGVMWGVTLDGQAPDGREIPDNIDGDVIWLTLPKLDGRYTIEINKTNRTVSVSLFLPVS